MRSQSYLFLLIVLGLAVLSGILFANTGYKYGLDVQGGVRLIYQMELRPEDQARLGQISAREYSVLDRRVKGPLGATEGTVQAKGADQFIIELPGQVSIEAARQTLGTTASLEYYWAKNVTTALRKDRYEASDREEPWHGGYIVTFTDQLSADKRPMYPDNPEYKKMIEGWELILKGDELKEARVLQNAGQYIPELFFNRDGARKMEDWCRKFSNRQENLAAVLDGIVLNIAPLKEGAIIKDNGIIEGNLKPEYVRQLVDLLNSGALPVRLNEISAQQVDPTIGKHALSQIVTAGIIAFCVIAAFMLIYYVFPGVVAVVALLLYILFTLSVLKYFATFSLAAIAGFVLSVGMAVDANILVFERVKEEMRNGRPLDKAIDVGFRRALSAIIDSNTCTILTSLVLAYLGTGPVKGFASTLIIGVLISLFTAVTVTRSLLMFLVGSGLGANPKWYGLGRQWFGESFEKEAHRKPLQIVNKAGRYFLISAITIVPGIWFFVSNYMQTGEGLKLNVEFQGGYEVVVDAKSKALTPQIVTANLEKAGFRGSNIQFSSNQGEVTLTVLETPELKKSGAAAVGKVAEAAGFSATDVRSFSHVGPTVRSETVYNAFLGVILSSALIIIYLAIRFGVAVGGFITGLRFSLSAIGALFHDILVVLGLAAFAGAVWGWQVSALFITAVLTMIGFSTHDTIVIFDRIRENLRRPHPNEDFGNLVNRSITQSFARSINTSGTVVVTLIILIIAGSATEDLKLFNAAMLIGIISGTYSSIYNASPILYLWDRAIGRRRGAAATLMAISEKEILHTKTTVSTVATPKAAPADEEKAKAYGQVRRRRASAVQRAQQNIDEDL